jgi:hypothetical protein
MMTPARLAELEVAWPLPEGRSTGTWAEIGPAVVIHELIAEIRRLTACKDNLLRSSGKLLAVREAATAISTWERPDFTAPKQFWREHDDLVRALDSAKDALQDPAR